MKDPETVLLWNQNFLSGVLEKKPLAIFFFELLAILYEPYLFPLRFVRADKGASIWLLILPQPLISRMTVHYLLGPNFSICKQRKAN